MRTGKADRSRIDTGEPYELGDWAKKFGVSGAEIKEALARVGPMPADVQDI